MATHSSVLAWRIPWREEPGGLQSMGSQRVRHDFANKQQQLYFKKKEGIPGSSVVKNPPANEGDINRGRFNPYVGKIPWRRVWKPTPIFLPAESHGERSLVGYRL